MKSVALRKVCDWSFIRTMEPNVAANTNQDDRKHSPWCIIVNVYSYVRRTHTSGGGVMGPNESNYWGIICHGRETDIARIEWYHSFSGACCLRAGVDVYCAATTFAISAIRIAACMQMHAAPQSAFLFYLSLPAVFNWWNGKFNRVAAMTVLDGKCAIMAILS